MFEFKLPEVGENIETGTVVSIFVKPGDTITKDQDLLELETDKASLPVPSSVSGVVKEVLIKEGDEVNIGQVVMKIEEGDSGEDSTETKDSQESQDTPSEQKDETQPESKDEAPPEQEKAPSPQPAAQASTGQAPQTTTLPSSDIPAQVDVPASPSVRRLARELGLDISRIPGTGPSGRISKEDVKAFAKGLILTGGAAALAPETVAMEKRSLPAFEKFGDVKREKMNNIRKKTAQHLSYCWQAIPHVTQFGKADITEIDKLRKEQSTSERKLTITPYLLKVMAAALKEFPQFNASIDMESQEIIYKSYFNIGVAVDTERGLLVPVLKDVEKKSVFDIADELNEMAERARNKKTALDELQGGSMTLTNLGGIGGTSFTPIVNWPEVSILGVSRGGLEPVWDKSKGDFTPRFMLPFSLSYDHRIIDGADGARFLRWVCEKISDVKFFT